VVCRVFTRENHFLRKQSTGGSTLIFAKVCPGGRSGGGPGVGLTVVQRWSQSGPGAGLEVSVGHGARIKLVQLKIGGLVGKSVRKAGPERRRGKLPTI
jgi:hypothetical protein